LSKNRIGSELSKRFAGGISKTAGTALRPFKAFVQRCTGLLVTDFDVYVIGSGISTNIEKYFELSAGALLIALVASFALSLFALSRFLPLLASLVAATTISLLVVLPLAMAVTIYLPAVVYKNRGEILESRAIHLLTALSLLAASGQTIYDVFKSLPRVLGRNYKLFSVEIDLATSLMAAGAPVDEALRSAARVTPSSTLKELFLSLSSLASIGTGIVGLTHGLTERYVVKHGLRIERGVEALNVYMEIYAAIAFLLPMLAGSFAALIMLAPVAVGISFDAFMALVTLILVPMASAIVIVMADVVVSRVRP